MLEINAYSNSDIESGEPELLLQSPPTPKQPLQAQTSKAAADVLEEAPAILEILQSQYKGCIQALAEIGLVDDVEHPYILDLNGDEQPAPKWDEIINAIPEEDLPLLERFKQPMLLITPFGLRLKDVIRRINTSKRLIILDNLRPNDSNIAYGPDKYTPTKNRGRKKRNVVKVNDSYNSFPGWQVSIVDAVENAILLENASAAKYLSICKKRGISPLTIDELLIMHVQANHQNLEIDSEEGTYALGSIRIPEKRNSSLDWIAVPYVRTRYSSNIIVIDGNAPQKNDNRVGARLAYRVLGNPRPKRKKNKYKKHEYKIIPQKKLGRDEMEEGKDIDHIINLPPNRGACIDGPRPCGLVSCRYHLYLDVTNFGAIKIPRPDIPIEEMKESCALDVADRGPLNLTEIELLLHTHRERVAQILEIAQKKLLDAGVDISLLGRKVENPPSVREKRG